MLRLALVAFFVVAAIVGTSFINGAMHAKPWMTSCWNLPDISADPRH
jgi:hypothetical protein